VTTRAIQFEFLLAGLRDPDTHEPLTGGSVEFYATGTSTPKNVWTEEAKTNAYTTYTLDTNGVAELFGDGNYKVVVKDSSGAIEYTFDLVKSQSNEFIITTVTSAAVTVTPDNDAILGNTSGNSITLNLEDIATFSHPIFVKKTSASNTLTVDPYSTQLIDGSSTYAMTGDGESCVLMPDNDAGQWRIANDIAVSLVGMTATVSELNTVADGITATAIELNAAADGIGDTIPRQKVIEIGDWNMDTTATKTVSHGLTLATICGVRGVVRDDAGTEHFGMLTLQDDITNYGVRITDVSSSLVNLERETGGTFDGNGFDSTSYNRGWVIVDYLVIPT
jgi:hypothetical protein